VPSIGLYRNTYYQQKQTGLFSLFDHPDLCIDTTLIPVSQLTEQMDRLIVERASLTNELKKINKKLATEMAYAHIQLFHAIDTTAQAEHD
jgi:hypothetical protein